MKMLVAVLALVATPVLAQGASPAVPGVAPAMPMRTISRAEVIAGTQRMFAMVDSNHDGVIDASELAAAQQRLAARRGGGGATADGAPQGRMGRGGMRGMGGGMGGMNMLMGMADANHDSRITLEEATALATRRFDMMDSNHDGQLSPEERAAGRDQMRAIRGQ